MFIHSARTFVLVGMLLTQHATAHESHQHEENAGHQMRTSRTVDMIDMTYLGSVDRVIGGHPYRTVGRRYGEGGELELSEVRSDGVLVMLKTASRSMKVEIFPPFEHAPSRASGTLNQYDEPPLEEMQPSIIVAAQSRGGDMTLYDRARDQAADHPYHDFVVSFDAITTKAPMQSGKPGIYVQVLPYLGEGPVDFKFDALSSRLERFLREPFKFHFVADRGSVLVDEAFVVLPKKPVLVEVGGERFVFYAYTLSETVPDSG